MKVRHRARSSAWRSCAVLAFVLATGGATRELAAQELTAPGAESLEGRTGFKVGSGRLHPSIQLDASFVTNPGRVQDNVKNAFMLAGRPGFELKMPSNQLDVSLGGDFEYQKYFSEYDELSAFAGRATFASVINKEGQISVRLNDHFMRSAEPGNQSITRRLMHVTNTAGIGFDLRPGGGALDLSLDYSFFVDRYDRGESGQPETLDNMRHTPALRASLKLLPKTAVFVEASTTFTNFNKTAYVLPTGATGASNVDSNILTSYVGLVSALTPKFSALLKAGYGNTFISGTDNFNSVVGQLELTYQTTATMKLRGGYVRTVQPVSLYKYYGLDKVYASYDVQLAGRVTLAAGADASLLSYGAPILDTGASGRADIDVGGNLMVSYQTNEWFTVSVIDNVDLRTSSADAVFGAPVGYFTNAVLLRLAARY